MNAVLLPPDAVAAAHRGHWRDAWRAVSPRWQQLLPALDARGLLWLHEVCLRMGLDVRRRALSRFVQRHHAQHPAVRAMRIVELVRTNRSADAWYAARIELPPDADADDLRAWRLARARLAAEVRDHDGAAQWLQRARDLGSDHPRLLVEQAFAHLAADRVDDALATCADGLARHPDDAALLQARCWIHHDANRADAGAHLAATRARLQSPFVDSLYASHCHETGDLTAARTTWEELVAQPEHERRARVGWQFGLMRVCRDLGDDDDALRWAEAAGRPAAASRMRLQEHVATRAAGERTRVVLPVPFVRQDHLTCSPATMAALLRTFGVHVEQREIAARITYDGTASSDELAWARERGLVVRFFQFEADAARQLLDRGLPFALTTRFETNSHRQAVVGYDRVLDTFVLRDPTSNFRREVPATWLTAMSRRGGDCALLLPAEVAAATAIPPLPAEAETMAWLQLRLDLEARRMDAFDRGVESLLATVRDPLRFDVLASVHHERDDRRASLQLWRDAHAEAPEDAYWQFHLATELLQQQCWSEARTLLAGWTQRSRSPFLLRLLAGQLRHDARTRPLAAALLRRALRALGREGRAWHELASVVWDEGRTGEASELYAVATTLAPHDEWLANSLWRARLLRGEVDEGLAFLRARVAAAGARSSAPAGTLADALESLHRIDEAIAVLRQALVDDDTPAQRTRLGRLLLRHHQHDAVRTLLDARERFAPIDHALLQHALARATGDRDGARTALRAAVAAVPTHVDAWHLLLEDVFASDGLAAALDAGDALVRDHADHPALLAMVAQFFQRLDEHARATALLQRLVAEHPNESWLRGRLSRHLIARGQLDAAAPLVDELLQTVPNSSPAWLDKCALELGRGDADAAQAAARRSLELDPENDGPLRQLLNLAPNRDDAIATLRLAMRALAERPAAPAVDALRHVVSLGRSLPPGELESWLRDLAGRFPATTAPEVARFELHADDAPATALPIAEALVAREPWFTPHHLALARCLRALNRREDERAALTALLQRDPGCAQAWVEIGESLEQEGRVTQALEAFERGLARAPGHAVLHGMVADAAWRLGDPQRALAAAQRAGELDPAYAWSFAARVRWLGELRRTDEALALTSQLVRDNPRWATAHELHAQALAAVGRHGERIDALRAALHISPRLGRQRVALIDALIATKRFDEARQVIDAGRALVGDDPLLSLREAEIERTEGALGAARDRLRTLLAKQPEFAAGWSRLLAWHEADGRDEEILALWREPPTALRDSAPLQGYAADVLQARGDLAGAEQALECALALDQGYLWARERLCSIVLERGRPERVLELLPDHERPERLPWPQAVLVAKAAARRGREELARAAFHRVLRDASVRGMAVGEVDALLRKRQPDDHDAALSRLLREADGDHAVIVNWLRVLACRGSHDEFFTTLTAARTRRDGRALPARPIAALLSDARRHGPLPGLAGWVATHVPPRIPDTQVAGELVHALSYDYDCQAQIVRVFGDDWRRPDVEGWMLANLADAFLTAKRYADVTAVSSHALAEVPHDHSYWWHRRYLAEAALVAGDFAKARELAVMPIHQHHGVRLAVHQIDLAARLHTSPWWRRGRQLRSALREMFRRYDLAVANGVASPPQLLGPLLWRACPGPTALLLCGGATGIRVLRALARV